MTRQEYSCTSYIQTLQPGWHNWLARETFKHFRVRGISRFRVRVPGRAYLFALSTFFLCNMVLRKSDVFSYVDFGDRGVVAVALGTGGFGTQA
jgi:hypothetical protein